MVDVSVVMSVYNGEKYLAEAVESILGQTLRDFEFVVVDDGSTDRTAEMLANYSRGECRLRVLRQENRGRAEALNRGTEAASGHLIARMDADDVALPERLEKQAEFMKERPDVGLLGSGVEFIGPQGEGIGGFQPPLEDGEIRVAMRLHNVFYHPTVMMRKEIVMAVGGYRKALRDADDYDLFLRIAEHSRMANLERPIVKYRVHLQQASVRKMSEQALCLLAACTAASLRAAGTTDPLDGAEQVTPELVRSMGVTDDQIRREALGEHEFWVPLLARVDAELALEVIGRVLELSYVWPPMRRAAARALLKAASIQYKRGRVAEALGSAGRGMLAQPLEAARIVGLSLKRRIRDVRPRRMTTVVT
jgi:cellulose synthase/poly-beta-1,6-N-acetylglucosamine synthase-like glycosyltransferase